MEEKRAFAWDCAKRFKSAGGLALQTVLKERMIEKHGASWWEFLRAHIKERGQTDAPGMTSYRNALVSLTGGEKTFSQLEITVLFASLRDLELLSNEEFQIARRINEHRRGLGHDEETDSSKYEEQEERYNEFWIESSKTLQDAIKVFGFAGEVKARIEAYCDAQTYDMGSAPSHEKQYEQATGYIYKGEKAKGIAILEELAKQKHIKSVTSLAEICLNGIDFPEMFNPEKAEEYCVKALLMTNAKESLMSGMIKEFNDLLELAENNAEANLKLIKMTYNHPLIKVNEKFILERLLCAHKSGADNAMELIKKHLIEHGYSQDAVIHLAEYGEYEFIADLFISLKLSVEELRQITRPCDELKKHHLEAVYISKAGISDKEELREFLHSGNELLAPIWDNKPDVEYPPEYLYLLAVICKSLGEFRKVLLLLKAAVDTSEDEMCRKMYEEYCAQALEISPDNEDAGSWYEVSRLLPSEIEKKLADEFWKAETDKLKVLNSTSTLRSMRKAATEIGELFKYESPMIEAYNEKFETVLAQTEIEEEKERERMEPILREQAEQRRRLEEAREKQKLELMREMQRKREERRRQEEAEEKRKEEERKRELEEIVGKKYEKGYWSDLEKAENDAKKICALKEKYTPVIGEMSWEFWRDENKLKSRLSEIDRRKEKYSAFFTEVSDELWQSDENVKAKLALVFGVLTDRIWKDTDALARYFKAHNVYLENQEIVRCKTWTSDTGFSLGNPDRYVPDEVNWEFWSDEEAVRKELRAFAAKKRWEAKYGEHNRDYWFENLPKLRELEKRSERAAKRASERAEKARRRRSTASNVLSAIAMPFKYILKLLQMAILPESVCSLGPGLVFTAVYTIAYITGGLLFITLISHRILYVFADMSDEAIFHVSLWIGLLVCYYGALVFYKNIHDVELNFYSIVVAPAILILCYAVITNPLTYHIMDVVDVLDEMDEAIFVSLPITQIPLVALIAAKIKEL